MHNIPMVDLVGQYQPLADEIQSKISDICSSAAFIGGHYVKTFSEDMSQYLDAGHVVPCANGTDALQLALMALELEPGDEVITTAFTFVATVEVVALLGLKPVFVDIDPDTFVIDPAAIEAAITPRTRAIVPVHLFGQAAPMAAIMRIADLHGLHVVEDNAQAIGCLYNYDGVRGYTGTIGSMGTYSFFPSKNLGCYGDGGAVSAKDEALASKVRMIANHGSRQRYHHEMIGVNSRLDNIQAAILHTKLPHLEAYNTRRRQAADWYDEALAGVEGVTPPKRCGESKHVFHQYTVKSRDRDGLAEHLKSKGVSHGIYYPIPLHRQEGYETFQSEEGSLPHTEQACREVLSLPMHSELTRETIDIVTHEIKSYLHG